MKHNIIDITAGIIARADRAHPADVLLREEVRRSSDSSRELSQVVFSYFRWREWLPPEKPMREQIQFALALAKKFSSAPGDFDDAALMARAVPAWVGEELEVTAGWVRSLQAEPRLWLRARPGQGRSLVRRLGNARTLGRDALADIVEYSGPLDLFRTPSFHTGEFEIQDISSQAVGLMCAPSAEETWWDACAGEGGKLLHLSDLMGNRGLIWASDRSAWRLQRLKRRAARARVFNFRSALWDGRQKLPTKTLFNGVLVDAPCSGLGTWQRNPHARWTTTLQDVRDLAALQKRLLAHTAKAVKQGGKLVYSVCTLTRSETWDVVRAFEATCPGMEPLPIKNPLQPEATAEHGVFLCTEKIAGNGMFVAAWKRSGGCGCRAPVV